MKLKINPLRIMAVITITLLICFFALFFAPELKYYSKTTYSYFVENTYNEVGSRNLVTGIYLDYRLFDSLFEAGILFAVTAGILFMSKRDEEVR